MIQQEILRKWYRDLLIAPLVICCPYLVLFHRHEYLNAENLKPLVLFSVEMAWLTASFVGFGLPNPLSDIKFIGAKRIIKMQFLIHLIFGALVLLLKSETLF